MDDNRGIYGKLYGKAFLGNFSICEGLDDICVQRGALLPLLVTALNSKCQPTLLSLSLTPHPRTSLLVETHLEESRHEARWQPLVAPEVLLLEVRHDVRGLLPEVHCLLKQKPLR